jgi:hypothetical protein
LCLHWKGYLLLWKNYNLFVECKDRGYDYNQDVNVCLKFVVNSNGSTWVDARSSCQDDGGDLISMTSVEKYNFVVHYMQNKGY